MHISLLPPPTPAEAAPKKVQLEETLAWLREELAHQRPEQSAALRHEIGVLEQLLDRDSQAVREHLAAANAAPRFKEPVEQLITLIERHRSFKNLPTLLDHLCKTADTPEELARAQLLRGWSALVHEKDETRAKSAFEAALAAQPDDLPALFALELVSRRLGDHAATSRALEGRSANAKGAWSGLSRLSLADVLAQSGQLERAREISIEVAEQHPELCVAALERQVALGRAQGRADWTLAALTRLADLITAALANDLAATARVPAFLRHQSRAQHMLLELGRLTREAGHSAAAFSILERARQIDPENPIVAHAFLREAFASDQHAALETQVPLAAAGLAPHEAAALWTGLARSRLSRNEPLQALAALDRALELHPTCPVSRALQLDLLRGTRDDRGYARALERLAQLLDDPTASYRHWLLAAQVWAHSVRDFDAARRALGKAEEVGAPPALCARVARMLAHLAGDVGWFVRATRAALAHEPEREQAALLLQLWRASTLGEDQQEAAQLRSSLESLPEGRFVSRLLRAYVEPAPDPFARAEAMHALASVELEPGRRALIEWQAALRACKAGQHSRAIAWLSAVHREQPGNVVVTGTLAGLFDRSGAGSEAARVLRATAGAPMDSAFSAALYVLAGLECWHAREREQALSDFQAAERRVAGSAGAFVSWVLRGDDVKPGGSDESRSRDAGERLLRAVEKVASNPTPTPQLLGELATASRNIGDEVPEALLCAARLLLLLYGRAPGARTDAGALERFAALNADCAELADAWRYLDSIGQADVLPKSLEENARRWAMSSGQVAAALEWLAAAQRLGHREREVDAWNWLGSLELPEVSEAARCNAALVAHLATADRVPIVLGESPEVQLTNLETAAPGCDPRRRIRALEGASHLYGGEAAALAGLLRGYNLLALGDAPGAAAAFRQYVDAFPDDPAGWEGVLAAARHGDDPALLAEAAAALGNTSRDPAHAARLFEEAADIFSERLHDSTAATIALSRAVELDIRRESSVERLLALLRETGDAPRLLELAQRRLEVCEDPRERLALEWERARSARKLGELELCMSALQRVLELEPNHPRALLLLAEVQLGNKLYAEAAESLTLIAKLDSAAPADRLTSGLCAVDLFENQLDQTPRALDVLSALHRAGLTTLPVRERLARAAAKSEAWDEAVVVLEQLMFERATAEHRAEAARLALAIHRDRRNDPRSAGPAAQVLLDIIPHDAEALELALAGAFEPDLTRQLLAVGEKGLLELLARDPLQPDPIGRLAEIAGRTDNLRLSQVALGALTALGHAGPATASQLGTLSQHIVVAPRAELTAQALRELADPEDDGSLDAVLGLVSPHVTRAFGPNLDTLRLGRRERVQPSPALPLWNEIAAWVGAFGLGPFDLYVAPLDGPRAFALATEPLAVIVDGEAGAPLDAFRRCELARSLYALKRGLVALTHFEPVDLGALMAALCVLSELAIPAPKSPRQSEFERQLSRLLPRKVRRALPDLLRSLRHGSDALEASMRACLSSLDRMSALAVGDVSMVVARGPGPGLYASPVPAPLDRLRRLISFALSAGFEPLREQLGVRVR